MASVTHSTPADGTFSPTGAAAWDAEHVLDTDGLTGPTGPSGSDGAAEVNAEIAMLLRKKLRTEDEEAMLLLMMAAVIA